MKACGITDVGLQRHENQDTFAVERGAADGQLIAVVCDGMGGENCGQIASSLAVRAFLDELHAVLRADMTTEQLREAVQLAHSMGRRAYLEKSLQTSISPCLRHCLFLSL